MTLLRLQLNYVISILSSFTNKCVSIAYDGLVSLTSLFKKISSWPSKSGLTRLALSLKTSIGLCACARDTEHGAQMEMNWDWCVEVSEENVERMTRAINSWRRFERRALFHKFQVEVHVRKRFVDSAGDIRYSQPEDTLLAHARTTDENRWMCANWDD